MATLLAEPLAQTVPQSSSVAELRLCLRRVFDQWERWAGPLSHFEVVSAWDETADRYVLMTKGWDGYRRLHSLLTHVELHDGKLWIEADGTEEGIASDLLREGVEPHQIVLGFQHPDRRKWGEFATE